MTFEPKLWKLIKVEFYAPKMRKNNYSHDSQYSNYLTSDYWNYVIKDEYLISGHDAWDCGTVGT